MARPATYGPEDFARLLMRHLVSYFEYVADELGVPMTMKATITIELPCGIWEIMSPQP